MTIIDDGLLPMLQGRGGGACGSTGAAPDGLHLMSRRAATWVMLLMVLWLSHMQQCCPDALQFHAAAPQHPTGRSKRGRPPAEVSNGSGSGGGSAGFASQHTAPQPAASKHSQEYLPPLQFEIRAATAAAAADVQQQTSHDGGWNCLAAEHAARQHLEKDSSQDLELQSLGSVARQDSLAALLRQSSLGKLFRQESLAAIGGSGRSQSPLVGSAAFGQSPTASAAPAGNATLCGGSKAPLQSLLRSGSGGSLGIWQSVDWNVAALEEELDDNATRDMLEDFLQPTTGA